jgi:hypothetical protein
MNRESSASKNGRIAPALSLADECRQTLQDIRLGLIEALAEARVDPAHPREAARQLGLDKSLMWRMSKIVSQPDVFQAVGNMPHRAGMGILCKAFRGAGVARETLERLEEAHTNLEALVSHHAGDRATFELVVRGLEGVDARGPALERDRKLAFRGNSALWSAQARAQLSTTVMAPNADDPSMVDVIHIFGLVDLRRFRSDVRWTLSRRQLFDDASQNVRAPSGEPLDPTSATQEFALIREFSSEDMPELIVEHVENELRASLPGGQVGRAGEMTALFGQINRALGSAHASETDRYAQTLTKTLTPAEHLHVDILVHEDLPWAMNPRAAIYGNLDGGEFHMGCGREGFPLPFGETVVELGQGLAGTATHVLPWYRSLLEWAFQRAGLDPADFRGFRFEMAYPPVPAQVILYSELLPPVPPTNEALP